jgi:hypothetical protein
MGEYGGRRSVSYFCSDLKKLVVGHPRHCKLRVKAVFQIMLSVPYFSEHSERPLPMDLFAEGDHTKKFCNLGKVLLVRLFCEQFKTEHRLCLAFVNLLICLFQSLVHLSPYF